MSPLSDALKRVRGKIARYRGKGLNEQNTKTALIDPVLRALAWDVGDLEEVQQEYKRKPRDKPVDYALLLLRTPRLFVEAKALEQDLNDRRWANQIMGYATVAGVEWVVITNGDEYRVYNACAPVPVEEKLFRSVCLSDEDSPAEETLALLSKEQISENQIETLWKAHFVDRQIRAVLEGLFSADPDASFVRLVKKQAAHLSSRDITASLRRVQATFDFPVEPNSVSPRPPDDGQKELEPPRPRKLRVSLTDVIEAGLIKPPVKLFRQYKGTDLEAELLPDGTVAFQGTRYRSCSKAAALAKTMVVGHQMRARGWLFWQFRDESGALVQLEVLRQQLLRERS